MGLLRALAPALVVGVLGTQGLMNIEERDRAVAVWLLLGQSLPLVLRSRLGVSVLVVTTSASGLQLLLGMPATNANLGAVFAAASLVSKTSWPRSLVPPAVVLVVNTAAAWAGNLPGVGRNVLIMSVSLILAWAIGDAAGRQAAVDASVERELEVRAQTGRWTAHLSALTERLRIAQELHRLVGEALDTIVVQAGAARLRPAAVAQQLTAIEQTARGVLAELDRFLDMLRRGPSDAPAGSEAAPSLPAAVVSARLPPRLRGAVEWVVDLGPVAVLLVLAAVENFAQPASERPGDLWLWLLTGAATLPLAFRRRWPRRVAAAVCAASAVQLLIGTPVANGVLAIAVAAHAVAVCYGRRIATLWGLGSTAVLVLLDARLDPADAVELGVVVTVMTLGAIYIGDATRATREHDASLLHRIEAVQAEGRLRAQAAVATERTEAARDLHDSIGHTMSLIVLQAGAARLMTNSRSGDAQVIMDALKAIERAARSALAELDAMLAVVVKPDNPAAEPIAAGQHSDLAELVADVRAAGSPVQLESDDIADLPVALRCTIFRLIQEALTNVVKHAPGAPARVRICRIDDEVSVHVTNPPAPALQEQLPSGSRGLVGMRERVSGMGGALSAGPDGSGGFTVDALLPIPRPATPAVGRELFAKPGSAERIS
ncbi:MAG TPA: histidine kinase [Propionibacteriaceae bacterium]